MATVASSEIDSEPLEQAKPPFLRRVQIRGYKSIGFCDVELEPLTILVGRNASGKSNFLDALAFLRDVVVKGLHEAVKLHGGRDAIVCRWIKSSRVSIEIEAGYLSACDGGRWTALFKMDIDFPSGSSPQIVLEHGLVRNAAGIEKKQYTVTDRRVTWEDESSGEPETIKDWPLADRVPLIRGYGGHAFSGLLFGLESMQTYNFNPEAMRRPQIPAPGVFLERDGSNLASTIETTRELDRWAIDRASRYLSVITRTVEFAHVHRSGGYETLRFQVQSQSNEKPMEFDAASVSDGTLRAFAALVAAFQVSLPLIS